MTKRELLEIKGYVYKTDEECFRKVFEFDNGDYLVIAVIDLNYDAHYIMADSVAKQSDIDNLQIAFNNLKRDFKEVQTYED